MGTNASNVATTHRSIPQEEQYSFRYNASYDHPSSSLTPSYSISQLGLAGLNEGWLNNDQAYHLLGSPSPDSPDSSDPQTVNQGSSSFPYSPHHSPPPSFTEGIHPREHEPPSPTSSDLWGSTSDESPNSEHFLDSLVSHSHSNTQTSHNRWSASPTRTSNLGSFSRHPTQLPRRNGYVDLTAESSPSSMAPTKKRPAIPHVGSHSSSVAENSQKRRKVSIVENRPQSKSEPREIEEVSLLGIDNDSGLTALLQKQKADEAKAKQNEGDETPKFSRLQCIICLETPTDLTATSCGHLFCHTCVMEALIAGESQAARAGEPFPATKSKCPVCRQRISRNPPKTSAKASSKVGFIVPLELKLKNQGGIVKQK